MLSMPGLFAATILSIPAVGLCGYAAGRWGRRPDAAPADEGLDAAVVGLLTFGAGLALLLQLSASEPLWVLLGVPPAFCAALLSGAGWFMGRVPGAPGRAARLLAGFAASVLAGLLASGAAVLLSGHADFGVALRAGVLLFAFMAAALGLVLARELRRPLSG